MSTFRDTLDARDKKPPLVVVLPPSAYARDWGDYPLDDMAMGLRVPSEQDLALCRTAAAQAAWKRHPRVEDEDGRVEAYNGLVMVGALARAVCMPDDATLPFFAAPEDAIPLAFTSETIKALFGELVRLMIELSPSRPEASDAELRALGDVLREGAALGALTPAEATHARRLLHYLVEMLMPYAPALALAAGPPAPLVPKRVRVEHGVITPDEIEDDTDPDATPV